jgi:hypothetical protein
VDGVSFAYLVFLSCSLQFTRVCEERPLSIAEPRKVIESSVANVAFCRRRFLDFEASSSLNNENP